MQNQYEEFLENDFEDTVEVMSYRRNLKNRKKQALDDLLSDDEDLDHEQSD